MPVYSFRLSHLLTGLLPPAAAGALCAVAASAGAGRWSGLVKPLFTPPGAAFTAVWLACCAACAFAMCRLASRAAGSARAQSALRLCLIKTAAGPVWMAGFFGLGLLNVSAVLIVAVWALELVCVLAALRSDRAAGAALLPSALWTAFCAYVCIGVAALN